MYSKLEVNLKNLEDITDPFKYDGSYEVVRRAAELYSESFDRIYNDLDDKDLDVILFLDLGSWKLSYDKKKERIMACHLLDYQKEELCKLIDEVQDKADNHFYAHYRDAGKDAVWGMFGTGTYSIKSIVKETEYHKTAVDFFSMVKDMMPTDDDENLFDLVNQFASNRHGGIQSGLMSQFLHCLKPTVFPILNAVGTDIYQNDLEVEGLDDPTKLINYADNCRKIKDFRDKKTNVKNYRVLDCINRKPYLIEIIDKIEVWENWKSDYNKWIPKYIEEAKTGKDLSQWDEETKNTFLSYYNGVSSNKQGCFSQDDKQEIAEHWGELAPHFASLAKHQIPEEEPKYNEYKTIEDIIGGLTSRKKRVATHCLIAALQPYYLCTIATDRDLHNLYNYISKYTCEEQRDWTGDWYEDSYNMLQLFVNATERSAYDIVTLPWQTYQYFIEKEQRENGYMNNRNRCLNFLKRNYNMILTGAPGTGKTYLAKQVAAALIGIDEKHLSSDEHFAFTQFHPSYDYTDFVEGLRPDANGTFVYKEGLFKEFCEKAANAEDTDQTPYVFIIDEINRGEISKIFGELFFAVDPDYRMPSSRILVKTQYQNMVPKGSKFESGFYVPHNVYIIGTMNDIDRSVESLDFAFRRRFPTIEIKVEDTIDGICSKMQDQSIVDEAKNRLNKLNLEISKDESLGRQYCIGASYLLKLNSNDDDCWQSLWDNFLQNLLLEYLKGFEPKEVNKKMKNFADSFGVRNQVEDVEY